MKTSRRSVRLLSSKRRASAATLGAIALAAFGGLGVACVGDSDTPAPPAPDAGVYVGRDAALPTVPQDASVPCVGSTGATCPGRDASADAAVRDATAPDASVDDATAPDASAPDTSVIDANAPDTSAPDSSVPDASAPDTSAPDAAVVDCTGAGLAQHFVIGDYTQTITMTGKTTSRVLTPETAVDSYLAHFDPTHCFDWAARVTGGLTARVAVDAASDAVYVGIVASQSNPVNLYGADDKLAATLTTTSPRGLDLKGQDVILARYTTAGALVWVKRMGVDVTGLNPGAPRITELAVVGSRVRIGGTLYIAKNQFAAPSHPVVFGPGEAGEQTLTIPDNFTIGYTASFDGATGAYVPQSVYTFHASPTQAATQVYVNAVHSGEVAVAGPDAGASAVGPYAVGLWSLPAAGTSLTFGAETASPQTLSTAAQSEPIFAMFGASGGLSWVRQVHASGGLYASTLLSSGAAVWLGLVQTAAAGTTVTFEDGASGKTISVGTSDFFLVRYAAAGGIDWLKKITVPKANAAYTPPDVVADEASDALYVQGGAAPGVVFGPGEAGQTTFAFTPSAGHTSAGFLARYQLSTGTFQWVRGAAEGQGGLFQNNLRVVGGEIVTGASVDKTTTFDTGGPNETTVGDGSGLYAGLARYKSDGSFLGFGELVRYPGLFLGGGTVEVVTVP